MKNIFVKSLVYIFLIPVFLVFGIDNIFGEGAPSCNEISWKDGNICDRKVVSDLKADLSGSYRLSFSQSVTKFLSNQTFNEGNRDVVANIWVIHNENGSWQAKTIEWITPNSSKVKREGIIDKKGLGHRFMEGKTYGFLVTGLIRGGAKNEQIRSKMIFGKVNGSTFTPTSSEDVSIESYTSKNFNSSGEEGKKVSDTSDSGSVSCNKITWIDGSDICNRELDSLFEASGNLNLKQNITKTLASETTNVGGADVCANVWLIYEDRGVWKGATWEFLRPNHTFVNSFINGNICVKGGSCKDPALEVNLEEGKKYGLMVSGLARNSTSNKKLRTPIVWGKIVSGKWVSSSKEGDEGYVGGDDYEVEFTDLGLDLPENRISFGCENREGHALDLCKDWEKAVFRYYYDRSDENANMVKTTHKKLADYEHRNEADYDYSEHEIVTIEIDGSDVICHCNNGRGGRFRVNSTVPSVKEIKSNLDYICGKGDKVDLKCIGENADGSSGSLEYSWDNGMTSSGISVLAGIYKCKVTNSDGYESAWSEPYKVKQGISTDITIDGETDIDLGTTTKLTCNLKETEGLEEGEVKIKWYKKDETGTGETEVKTSTGSNKSVDISDITVTDGSGATNTGETSTGNLLDGLEVIGTEKTIEVGSGTYICKATMDDLCFSEEEVSVIEHKKPLPLLSCDVNFVTPTGKVINKIKAGEKYSFNFKDSRDNSGEVSCTYVGMKLSNNKWVPDIRKIEPSKEIVTNIESNSSLDCSVEYPLNNSGALNSKDSLKESATCNANIDIIKDSIYPSPNCELDFIDKTGEKIEDYVKLSGKYRAVFSTTSEVSEYYCYYSKERNGKILNNPIKTDFSLAKIGENNKNKENSGPASEEKRIYTCIVKNKYNNVGTCTKTLIFTNNIPTGYCGDGKIQRPNKNSFMEQCDGGYGCSNRCIKTIGNGYCGDGIVQKENGEKCDGEPNCAIGCGIEEHCGDGIVQSSRGEECDSGLGCGTDCKWKDDGKKDTKDRDPKDYDKNYMPNGKNEDSKGCGRYIAGYKEVKLPCEINGEWNGDTIDCAQEVKYEAIWKAIERNPVNGECESPIGIKVPDSKSQPRGGKIKLTYLNHTCDGLYADGKQSCYFKFELALNLNSPEEVGIDDYEKIWVGDFDYDGAYIDQTNTGNTEQESGLLFKYKEKIKEENNKYFLYINTKSTVPFSKLGGRLSFNIQGLGGIGKVTRIIPKLSFKKPLQITKFNTNSGLPELGKIQSYNVTVDKVKDSTDKGLIDLSNVKNAKLLLDGKYLNALPKKDYKIIALKILNRKLLNVVSVLENAFELRIDSKKEEESALLDGGQTIELLDTPISYILNDKKIKYFLDVVEDKLKGCMKKSNGLLVEGGVQFDGKGNLTGQGKNFSDLSISSLKNSMKKSVNNLIKGRENKLDQKVGSVYLAKNKDVLYSNIKDKLSSNDTLILEKGNFIIDEDIKTAIGIIVLNDDYNVKNVGSSKNGNIFITNNVGEINAIIYSDGAILSRDKDAGIYEDKDLNKQLLINGSLFTTNTIGGAIAGTGENKYRLPGGYETLDFEEAEIFDLNYLRKVDLCKLPYSTKVKYNSKFLNNPPAGFSL